MPITRPWKIAGAATIALGAMTGVAMASGGIELQDRSEPIELTAAGDDTSAGTEVDLSPESADSPSASPFDSPESASDSPGDPGWVDLSPESADSPSASPLESPDSAADSPDDGGWVAPPPPPAPPAPPAPAPAFGGWGSADSPDYASVASAA